MKRPYLTLNRVNASSVKLDDGINRLFFSLELPPHLPVEPFISAATAALDKCREAFVKTHSQLISPKAATDDK